MVLLVLMLLLFPVLYLDIHIFLQKMQSPDQPARSLAPGMLLGSISFVVLIFINIFTNVWGYIEPISPLFRNTFWLSYFLLSGGITLLVSTPKGKPAPRRRGCTSWEWAVVRRFSWHPVLCTASDACRWTLPARLRCV
jgi:hypothetical protein